MTGQAEGGVRRRLGALLAFRPLAWDAALLLAAL